MDYLRLSKIISYALRHAPKEYNLVLDENGWADINVLLASLQDKHTEFAMINYGDLLTMLKSNPKRRHDLDGQRIRALYGHSIKALVKKEAKEPPLFLFHGTDNHCLELIKVEGLKKMARQYVHLSSDIEQAGLVANRKTKKPVLLKIRATDAALSGIKFYQEDNVWLCDFIPTDFIETGN